LDTKSIKRKISTGKVQKVQVLREKRGLHIGSINKLELESIRGKKKSTQLILQFGGMEWV